MRSVAATAINSEHRQWISKMNTIDGFHGIGLPIDATECYSLESQSIEPAINVITSLPLETSFLGFKSLALITRVSWSSTTNGFLWGSESLYLLFVIPKPPSTEGFWLNIFERSRVLEKRESEFFLSRCPATRRPHKELPSFSISATRPLSNGVIHFIIVSWWNFYLIFLED